MLSNEGFERLNCGVLRKMRFKWSPVDTASNCVLHLHLEVFVWVVFQQIFLKKANLKGDCLVSIAGNKKNAGLLVSKKSFFGVILQH